MDTRAKRPAVRGWQEASPGRARQWAEVGRLGAMDGLGLVMGKPSGITEIDVDAVGEAWVAAALNRFGETPVIIRTASGKSKLWYRHNGEGRHIRPFDGLPIDVLGGGFTIAPPSYRPDLGAAYQFVSGGLDDLRRLPVLRTDALPTTFSRDPGSVRRGERNDSLWRYCMVQARFCDDLEALMDVALTWSDGFADLCLQGWSWDDADLMAREMLGDAFRAVNAHRPTWEQGQPEWIIHAGTLIERTRCIRCHKPLPEGHHKFCGNACAASHSQRLARRKEAEDDRAVKMAILELLPENRTVT